MLLPFHMVSSLYSRTYTVDTYSVSRFEYGRYYREQLVLRYDKTKGIARLARSGTPMTGMLRWNRGIASWEQPARDADDVQDKMVLEIPNRLVNVASLLDAAIWWSTYMYLGGSKGMDGGLWSKYATSDGDSRTIMYGRVRYHIRYLGGASRENAFFKYLYVEFVDMTRVSWCEFSLVDRRLVKGDLEVNGVRTTNGKAVYFR